jgi:hypothetical protein
MSTERRSPATQVETTSGNTRKPLRGSILDTVEAGEPGRLVRVSGPVSPDAERHSPRLDRASPGHPSAAASAAPLASQRPIRLLCTFSLSNDARPTAAIPRYGIDARRPRVTGDRKKCRAAASRAQQAQATTARVSARAVQRQCGARLPRGPKCDQAAGAGGGSGRAAKPGRGASVTLADHRACLLPVAL